MHKMFYLIFKIFIIFLNIISSTCTSIVFFDEWGRQLSTSSTTVSEHSELMIPWKVLEEVMKHNEKVISEKDQKISEKDQKIGNLDTKLKIFSKILRILGVRSRAEKLVDDLYPGGRKPYHIGVAKAYEEILTSTKPEFEERSCIKIFRQRVSSYGISTADFVDAIRSIYASLSDNAAHKMSAFEPSPPKYNDTVGIEEMFEAYGITPDEYKVKTAQIILQPLPLSSTPARLTSTNDNVSSIP